MYSTLYCTVPGSVQFFVLNSTWECTVLCIVQYLGVFGTLYCIVPGSVHCTVHCTVQFIVLYSTWECTVPGSVPLTGGRPKTGWGPGSEKAEI